jgi:septum site-determining protein MinD
MEKVIAVVSGKGGVGKTTFTSNIGLALKRFGKDVTVLDGDMSNSNLGLQLGFFQFPLGLQDALKGGISIHKAVYTHPSGLNVIPSSISMKYIKRSPNPGRLKRLIKDLRGVVLIDSPPGVGSDVEAVIRAADDVVIVTNPEIPAVTDALKAVQLSRGLGKEPLGVVLNRTGDRYELRPEEVEAMCSIRVLGSVPEDRAVKKSIFNRNPVVHEQPNSRSSVAFMGIAAGLAGMEYRSPRMLRMRRLFRR